MAIRITGLNSGLDTESIITQLVSAKKTSVNNLKKEQTKLSWKIDAWKSLNTKILSLHSTIDKLRFDSAYVKKKSTVSQTGILSVVAGETSVNGVQTASVESLAKAGYLTGGKLKTADGGKVTADTKVVDLGITAGSSFKINDTEVNIDENTTISGLVSQLKESGVEANFDENQQRLYINAKETGKDNDFSFTGDDALLKTLGIIEDASNPDGAVKIKGENAVMYLNGARYESTTNTFQVNGTTYTATGVSDKNADGSLKELSITTMDDYDGIYDTIRDFFKQYNSLINEMDKLYNAESSKGYEPLLSEEKEALTDTEVEEWEKKIKDSLLRKDSSLNSVISSMTTTMMGSVSVNGKDMYLSSFGIATLGYFNAEENEKHAYHIPGDPNDTSVAEGQDILKSMIASDPETVKSFFSQLSNNLYNSMSKTLERIPDFKSYRKAYSDLQLNKELEEYKTKISKAEEALTAYEDKWYDKFAAMETALSKLSSKQNAISSLFSS